MYVQPVGTPKLELDTPALILDLDVVESNIARMADFLRDKPARIRPHMKTHKTPALAYKQLAAGAIGVTCAKLGEAEVMAQAGINDILIANQIVGAVKIERLMSLARYTDIMVAVDDEENVADLDAAAGRWSVRPRVLVEVDNGTHRCGVQRGEPTIRLASQVAESRNLRLAGVMGYEGFAVFIPDAEERARAARGAMEILTGAADDCRGSGLEIGIVSAGGTGTYRENTWANEIQAGSYALMDTAYGAQGLPFRQALTVLARVIHVDAQGWAVADLGLKSLGMDHGLPSIEGATVWLCSDEHTTFAPGAGGPVSVGDRVAVRPAHVDPTVAYHERMHVVQDGEVIDTWEVDLRGW